MEAEYPESKSTPRAGTGHDFHERVALTVGGRGALSRVPLGLRSMANKSCLVGATTERSGSGHTRVKCSTGTGDLDDHDHSTGSGGSGTSGMPLALAIGLMACEAPRRPKPCTFIDDLFRGSYAQMSRCEHCGNLHVTVQDWLALALPLSAPRRRIPPKSSTGGSGSGAPSSKGTSSASLSSITLSKRDRARLRKENDKRRREGRPILGHDFTELPAHRQPKGTSMGSHSGTHGVPSRAELELMSVLNLPGDQVRFLKKG